MAQIISHELTHSIETSSSYGELSGLVFDRLKATGEDIDALRTAKRELYERNGVTLADETAIDQEIVAEYVEKNLLTDEKSIKELAVQKRGLAQRISDWIDSVLAKLGNKDAGERAFLNRAKKLYAKALRAKASHTLPFILNRSLFLMMGKTAPSSPSARMRK